MFSNHSDESPKSSASKISAKGTVVALALTVSALALPGYNGYTASQTPKPPTAMDDYRRAVKLEQQGDIKAAEAAIRDSLGKAPADTLNTIKLAQLLVEQGRYNEAESLYKQAISLDANDAMIYFHLGGLYEQTGKYADAKTAYANGLQRNPQYTYGLYNLARTQIQLQEYNDAIGSYRQFLTHYPNHFEARQRLASLYLVAGQPEASAHEYSELQRQFPEHFTQHLPMAKALTRAKKPEQALEELKAAFVQDGNKADVLQEMGLAHMSLGQTDYALQNFEKAFNNDPTRKELLLQMADIQFEGDKLKEAEDNYRKYLEHTPEDNNVRYTLAGLLMKQEKYDGAIEQLTTILQTNVNETQRYNLEKETAYAFQMKGDLMHAIPRYEALMKTQRANDDVQLKTNLALAYHNNGNLEEAVNMYKSAYYQWQVHGSPQQQNNSVVSRKALAADLSNAMSALGDKAYKSGEFTEALQHYGEAGLYSNDEQFAHLVGLGNSYLAIGIKDKAKEAYTKALEINPNNKTAKLYLAKIDLEENNNADSLPILEKLAEENPTNLEFQLALGDAYAQLGQHDKAVVIYQNTLNNQQLTDPQQREAILLSLGAIEQSQKKFEKALQTYQMALSIEPNNPKTHYNLGIIYNELNQLERSIAAYKQALTLDRSMTQALYGMAVTYEKQQKFADAINTYDLYVQGGQGQYITQAKERIALLKNAINPTANAQAQQAVQPKAPQTEQATQFEASNQTTTRIEANDEVTVSNTTETSTESSTPTQAKMMPLKPAVVTQEQPVFNNMTSQPIPVTQPVTTQQAEEEIAPQSMKKATPVEPTASNTEEAEDENNFMRPLTISPNPEQANTMNGLEADEEDEVTNTLTTIPNASQIRINGMPINAMNVAEPKENTQDTQQYTTQPVRQIQMRIDPMGQ